jgi:hypothetical protein
MQPKLKKSMFWIVLAGLVNIIFVLLGTRGFISDATVIIIVGVFSFFSMLALSSYFSDKESLLQGELRKAIATSLLMVYFTILAMAVVEPGVNILALSATAEEESVSPKIFLLKDFSALIAVVVGFYFGGRSAEEIIKTWKGKEQGTNSDEGLG